MNRTWYLDRHDGVKVIPNAATCSWNASSKELSLRTYGQYLRADGVNITKVVDAIALQYQGSYTVNAEELGEILVFCLKYPREPRLDQLYLSSKLLAELMWGRKAELSATAGEGKMEYGYTGPGTGAIIPDPQELKKKSKYQDLFEEIMKQDTALVQMDLNQPEQVIKPEPAPKKTSQSSLDTKALSSMNPMDFMKAMSAMYPSGYPVPPTMYPGFKIKPNPIDKEALKKLNDNSLSPVQSAVQAIQQAESTSPSPTELATLENDDLGRDC